MQPVSQDKLYQIDGIGNGNCFAACLASLLEIPLWMVPPFDQMAGRGSSVFYERAEDWVLRMFGKELRFKVRHDPDNFPEHYIACGQSARGVSHAVIYKRGVLEHDPHPSGDGITSVEYCYFLVENPAINTLEPARVLLAAAKEAASTMDFANVFVTTRQRIKKPEGEDMYRDHLEQLKAAIKQCERADVQ